MKKTITFLVIMMLGAWSILAQPTATLSYPDIEATAGQIVVPVTIDAIDGDNVAAGGWFCLFNPDHLTFIEFQYPNSNFPSSEWAGSGLGATGDYVGMVWTPADFLPEVVTAGEILIEMVFEWDGTDVDLIYGNSGSTITSMFEEDPPGSFNYVPYELTLINGSVAGIPLEAPQNLDGTVVEDDISLTWEAPAGTKDLQSYNVYRDGTAIANVTDLFYDDMDLPDGMYTYCVTAVYDEGESGCSNEITLTVDANIDPPANLNAFVIADDVKLTWEMAAKGFLGFKVYRDGTELTLTTDYEYFDYDLADGTYTYCVTSFYDEGESDCAEIIVTVDNGGTVSPEATFYYPELITGAGSIEVPIRASYINDDLIVAGFYCYFDAENLTYVDVTFPHPNFPADEWVYGLGADYVGMNWLPSDFLPEILWPEEIIAIIHFEWNGTPTQFLWGDNNSANNAEYEAYDLTMINGYVAEVLLPVPTNLTAEVVDDVDVQLNWDAPETDALLGYDVFRNGSFLVNTADNFYLDEDLDNGEYSYYVRAIYDEGESFPSNTAMVNIFVAYAPTNLTSEVMDYNDVELNWDAVTAGGLEGYNVWRDGSTIAYTTDNFYMDMNLGDGTYCWQVTAVFDQGESDPSNEVCETIENPVLDPPTNLVATYQAPDAIQVTWVSPVAPPVEEWIHWDDGTNADAIGLTSGGTFYIASHWDPADLVDYNGAFITKLTFFAGDYAGSTYTLKVWTGPNASTEVLSQAVPSYTQGAWNEFDLSSSVMIDASQELWFGYEVTHGASTFPAGCDGGPAIQGYGDMISMNGSSWESMGGAYGLDYNWNMQAFVTSTPSGPVATPMVKTIIENPAPAEFTVVEQHSENPTFNPTTREFQSFDLFYEDGTFITNTTATSYLDEGLTPGEYCYYAVAVYDEGDSEPSNIDCAEIPYNLLPPTNLEAECNEPDVELTWTEPGGGSGELIELTQHDNNPQNGYYQNYDYGYGVVFDISAYPGCTIEFMDFRHSSWGITGTWDYTIHVVDWDTYTEVYETPVFQSTCNDCWEEEVDLGSLAGESGLVGIFLEPMSNDPADAYPCLDSDDVGPDGMSYFGALPDYSGFGISGIGDFLIDLWIMTAGERQMVKAPRFIVNNPSTEGARNESTIIEGWKDLQQTENTRGLNGYNIYRNGVNIDYTTSTSYTDEDVPGGLLTYCVTAVYDEGESECSNEVTIECGSGEPLFQDDFDAHTAGEQLVCQGAEGWTTWSGTPCNAEDPYVTTDEYNTPNNSIVIEGTNDVVHPIPDLTTGDYQITFNIFVPDGYIGYFNTLSYFAGTASNWAMQAYFDLDGFGLVDAGGAGTGSFFFDNDTWVPVKVRANLDEDEGTLWVNNTEVVQWIWSTGAFGDDDLLQLGGSNFYAWSDNGTPLFYIDDYVHDFYVGVNEPMEVDNFTKVYPNPATNAVNIASDADIVTVEVFNFAGQMIANELVNTKFHTINTETYDAGVYVFRVTTENGVSNQRIIIE